MGAGVGRRESPALPVCVGPGNRFMQVCLQVNDRVLPVSIGQFRVIPLKDHIQHDGARTEVERHAVTDAPALMAAQTIREPTLLNRGHADGGAGSLTPNDLRIAPQAAVSDNGGQPVHMDDMINFRPARNRHGQSSTGSPTTASRTSHLPTTTSAIKQARYSPSNSTCRRVAARGCSIAAVALARRAARAACSARGGRGSAVNQ